jgi:hypothetical protein
MTADYIEILSDDDDVIPKQSAARSIDDGPDAYILFDDDSSTVRDGRAGKQRAGDNHQWVDY